MYDLFLKTIEKYHFRDEQGHPIENCEEVREFFKEIDKEFYELVNRLDQQIGYQGHTIKVQTNK